MNKRELEAVYQNEFNKAMKELNERQQQVTQEQKTVQQEVELMDNEDVDDEIEDIDTTGGSTYGGALQMGTFTMMAAGGFG